MASFGMVPEGFRPDVVCGARPQRPTGISDLVLDAYLRGMMGAVGTNPDRAASAAGEKEFHAWSTKDPDAAFEALRGLVAAQRLTGTYQCTRRGVEMLYDAELDDYSPALNARIQAEYGRVFAWYRDGMKRAHFSELIRIVHPEYYVRDETPECAQEEAAFTHTIMRIDPLLGLWQSTSTRRDGLVAMTGIDPVNAETWRAFLERIFAIATEKNARGIKQLQAYRRVLDYSVRADEQVVWRGELTPEQIQVQQDWIVRECCRLADARGWVHQIHVGTHNLTQSSPMPLQALAKDFPNMKIVMLHCWPFLQECGWLSKYVPNIYIDSCWQPILNPEFYREALRLWLNYVPLHKITCGHDATSIEMAAGSSRFTREALSNALDENKHVLGMKEGPLMQVAADFLHNNSSALYGVGARVEV